MTIKLQPSSSVYLVQSSLSPRSPLSCSENTPVFRGSTPSSPASIVNGSPESMELFISSSVIRIQTPSPLSGMVGFVSMPPGDSGWLSSSWLFSSVGSVFWSSSPGWVPAGFWLPVVGWPGMMVVSSCPGIFSPVSPGVIPPGWLSEVSMPGPLPVLGPLVPLPPPPGPPPLPPLLSSGRYTSISTLSSIQVYSTISLS